MADFYIKQGDQLPSLQATLEDINGVPVDLTGTSIRFQLRSKDSGLLVVDQPGVLVTPAAGVVRYDWGTGETDVPGEFEAEWAVTYPSTKKLTIPTNTMISVSIMRDVR